MHDRFRTHRRRHSGLLAAGFLVAGALWVATATPELMQVERPRPGSVVGLGGVEVMVRFPPESRIAVETFRVLLNGADTTAEFTSGANGAYGRLHGLLDGENRLRFEAFGRRWWLPGRLVEEAREVRFLVRRPQDFDRG
jgi:hypothetical protein